MRAAVARLPDLLSKGAAFHFGWHDGEHNLSGVRGKMIRPALVLSAARLAGGEPTDDTLRAGVAVELVHNFSLVHDDLVDEDRMRHRRPTVWAQFGSAYAVQLGDAMLALANLVLMRGAQGTTTELCAELNSAVMALCVGQVLDVEFETRPFVSTDDYLEMVTGKTAALLSASCGLGALTGSSSPAQLSALRQFGHHMGLAFQLTDDLLGIFGDPAVTGKPVGADLLRYKKTMPVVAATCSGSAAGDELREIYQRRAITRDRLEGVIELVACAGGRERTEAEAVKQYDLALRCLDEADGNADATAELRDLAALMIKRDR
ncbi:polyprenyl synthetase family protein [Lentzea alba]|uniref:polyprenyl synthetase family protein n=1 Tax=Lentzea alba TaxID=2714351 RepID=UPI0039BFC98F